MTWHLLKMKNVSMSISLRLIVLCIMAISTVGAMKLTRVIHVIYYPQAAQALESKMGVNSCNSQESNISILNPTFARPVAA